MDVPANLLEAAELLSSNPYRGDARTRDQARALLQSTDVMAAAASQLGRNQEDAAETLLLALAAEQAISATEVLPEARFEAHAILHKLPHPREAYVRVALANTRCRHALDEFVGASDAMQRTRSEVWSVSFGANLQTGVTLERVIRDHDVLIVGETGTGKETVATAILEALQGPADGGPAPRGTINAAALPETLTEGELFGHARGAYTGATENRVGRIRSAHGGGFFLDEVGDLPLSTQSKLLRVIELDEVAPLGSDKVYQVDVRFIAATHRNLLRMVQEDHFRRDLYERLAGCVIQVPPLRERPEDIPVIGMRFVRSMVTHARMAPHVERMEAWLRSSEARSQPWPGNVRELHNALRNLMLGLPAQPALHGARQAPPDGEAVPATVVSGRATLDEVDEWYMRKVLKRAGGKLAEASRILGVDRSTLRRRSKRWGGDVDLQD